MMCLYRDLIHIIYNYCDINCLRELSLVSKYHYQCANIIYYEKRLEKNLKISIAEFNHINNIIHDKVYDPLIFYNDKTKKNKAKNVSKILKYPTLLFEIENNLLDIYFTVKNICLKFKDNDKKIIKRLLYQIRHYYFRKALALNNITYLPKLHSNKNKCKLSHINKNNLQPDNFVFTDNLVKTHNIVTSYDNNEGYKFIYIDKLKEYKEKKFGHFPANFYNCLSKYHITSVIELSVLYNFYDFGTIYLSGLRFIKGEIVNGIYFAYFSCDDFNHTVCFNENEFAKYAKTVLGENY